MLNNSGFGMMPKSVVKYKNVLADNVVLKEVKCDVSGV